MLNKIYIIIVTYNGVKWIQKCLESCQNYPVIVVDNNSKDNTIPIIEKEFVGVTLIKQTNNLGFGIANNIGIRKALDLGADYVFLLNQDAYLVAGTIENLIKIHQSNLGYGILSPIHLNGTGNKLDRNFSYYVSYDKNKEFYSDFIINKCSKNKLYQVPFVNAAAWLLPKSTLKNIGGFDPIFFHYGEDDNYCQKVINEGLKIGVVSDCYVKHDRENVIKRPIEGIEQKLNLFRTQSLIKYANVNFDGIKTPQSTSLFKKVYWFLFKNQIYIIDKRKSEIIKDSFSKGNSSKVKFFKREEYQYL